MPHKRRNKNYLFNTDLRNPSFNGLPQGAMLGVTKTVGVAKSDVLGLYEYNVEDTAFTLVDDGANGAGLAVELFTWPAAMIWVVAASLEVSVTAAAAGISATANVNIGVGSTAFTAAGSDPATTEIDMIASLLDFDLVAGAKADQRKEGAAAHYVNGTAGTAKTYLNFYIPAADQSADGALTADVIFKAWYLTL